MKSDWTMKLTITEKRGSRTYQRAIDLDVADFGERLAGEMDLGIAFLGPGAFAQTASVIKKRHFRRQELIAAAKMLGMGLADFLEDREGWHGEQRQEATLGRRAR